jgi:hypothetical protein
VTGLPYRPAEELAITAGEPDQVPRPGQYPEPRVLARLRFPQEELLNVLGGSQVMHESPLIQELIEETSRETKREAILGFLRARFGAVSEEVVTGLHAIRKASQLDPLVAQAGACLTLEGFQKALQKALLETPPKKKRRSKP